MPPVVPAHRPAHFPLDPSETESTSTSPQFRSGSGSSTIVYTHQRVSLMYNFPRQHNLDRTHAISENKTPLGRPYNVCVVEKCVVEQ
jgi:hypothetical protein